MLLQIEQLGMVLRRLLAELTGAPKDGTMIERTDRVDLQLLAAIGLGDRTLDNVTSEELTTKLQMLSGASVENLDILADVLLARSAVCEAEQGAHSVKLKDFALAVLEHANTLDTNYSMERQQKLVALRSAR